MLSPGCLHARSPRCIRSCILPEAGGAEEVAQDRAFKRAAAAEPRSRRPWQIDREVERGFADLNHQHPVGESQRFSDIVGDEMAVKPWSCHTRSMEMRVKESRVA